MLSRLLRALAQQTLAADAYEVIVIVDGSADGTCEMLSDFDAPYRLIWKSQARAGRAAACNAGIALARGAVLVLIDDDMEPSPVFVQAHAAEHAGGRRRAVMGAAPVLIPPGSPAVVEYIGRKFNRHLDALASRGGCFGLRAFYSGNLSIPREVLVEVGGFDEEFKTYGNEDLELSCRLRSAGVEIAFSPAAVAHQHYVKDFPALARDNLGKGTTAVLLARKHPGTLRELKLSACNRGPALRRLILDALVGLTRLWPATSHHIVTVMCAAGRLRPPGLDRAYGLAVDYFFLLGATEAGGRAPIHGKGGER